VFLYHVASLLAWDIALSHDQTGYNISMMVTLDLYNHGHNASVLYNCNIPVVCDLFLVLFHLELICTPEM